MKLTQQYIKSLFTYKNGNLYWKNNRGSNKVKGNKAGSLSGRYYRITINGKSYYTHRLIYLYYHDYLPEFIDHIDRNKQNNKIENLRETTLSENQWNRKSNINSTSIYKGVDWDKSRNKWQARIQINGKRKHLGYFINEIEASKVYNKAAIKYFGKHAHLNEV